MADRINELMLEAGNLDVPQVWFQRPEVRKLAKLIIAECVALNNKHLGDRIDLDLIYQEHFGVKK
jgi:hypothetical protein